MPRKRKHEDHINHEAWAIPYGDLITLLLAFFVVMYAISSVNEGKFRVLSDSLQSAFRGSPKTLEPVQVGDQQRGSGTDVAVSMVPQNRIDGPPETTLASLALDQHDFFQPHQAPGDVNVPPALNQVADEVEKALAPLIAADMVAVRRHATWLEIEIRTDILFSSGDSRLSAAALPPLTILAETLRKYPNPVRVEGHTDNRPFNTAAFPSNWELSAARAASVVHLFAKAGVDPAHLAVIGLGQFRPAQSNATVEGRNANRRVLIVILAGSESPEGSFADDKAVAGEPVPPPKAQSTPAMTMPNVGAAAVPAPVPAEITPRATPNP